MTGYIAGDALYALNKKHPDYEYAALVRTQEKADIVKKAYPNVRIVLGGNDDSEILKKEAANADVVLRKLPPAIPCCQRVHIDPTKMLQMLPTTKEPPRPSLWASDLATQRRSPVTGYTPAAPAS